MAERIRAHDWSATPLGPIAAWSERLKLAVELTLASPLVSTLVCGPPHLLIYNDAAARLYGDRHPAALGRPLPDTFPEGWATVAPFYARAFTGETVQVRGQPLDTRGEGTATEQFDALLVPVRESDGSVASVHMTGAEVADRVRIEAALRESETRHRLLIESWAQASWETDARGVVVADSPSWRAYTGQSLDEWLVYGWLDAIHPNDRPYAEQQWREAIGARQPVNAEFRLRAPDGGWRWTNVRAAPVLGQGGRIEKWAGMNIDIDARKSAEVALRQSEERLHVALASAELGTFVWHVAEDRTEEDAQARAQFGLPPDGTISLADALATTFHPDDGPRYAAAVARAIDPAGPGRLHEEYRIRHPDGQERWMSTTAITTFEGTPRVAVRLTGALADVTDRKRAEAALQASEERQAFLLKLSDALRSLRGTAEVRAQACQLLGEHLAASRVYYVEYQPDQGYGIVADDYLMSGLPSLAGCYPFEVFRSTYERIGNGRTWIVPDVTADEKLPEQERTFYSAQGVIAWVNVPLAKDGILEAALCVVQTAPREWTTLEITLVEETAERLWAAIQRARAEAALRESEERFQQFARASAAGLWIRDADTLVMEFVSPAVGTIYGVEPDGLLGDVRRWAAMIVPEDREAVLKHLEAARGGGIAVHEFRIQRPSDGAFRWIRNTDFLLRDDHGRVQRIGGIAEDVTETRRLTEHQGVLVAELQHRGRNIMGMIRSLANRTAPGASDIEEYRLLLEGRLLALARVQALLTQEANAGGSLQSIIESEVAAQAHHCGQYALTGPDIQLSPKAVEVLTLAFHELATNALKYGALSVPEGRLSVSWTLIEKRSRPWVALDWIEEGAPSREPATRRGFGSELIEARIPYELGGKGTITIAPEGARCQLEFPLKGGESILETDAPQPATIFGGTLDMTGAPDLTGRTVLVVEDDYFLATDTAKALRGAGAKVLGPCPNEEATRDLLEEEAPTHAVLDLNLGGGGPRFEIAHLLKARGIPFIFLTGYDPNVVPEDLADVVRLQKPLPFRSIIEAVGLL